MPPKKQQLDHSAWSWAESIEPENVSWDHLVLAYRLNLKACKRRSCRRNCKGNPRCVNALGESKWFNEIDENTWHEIDDPEGERREKVSFAGLKNLGATCYVNTFLQVWFHNKEIRRAVFGWQENLAEHLVLKLSQELSVLRSLHTPEELDNLLTPATISGQLQNVFALLQFSHRRYIDPTPFVSSLGLNAALQQDAQEFSKLFMSLLEDTLSQQQSPETQNFVKKYFKGLYEYVTRCSFCHSESKRPSDFYELDLNIKGHKHIHECVAEFLKEEKLEGDNKYMCSACNSKQNAVRYIRLKELPNILNLQLLRFVFERQTGHKKKLNTFIEFPETLDMSGYLSKEEGSVLYQLAAVFIHRGPSAYSGHYVAHVKDSPSNAWYKFNDEQIQKMEGKNLHLGNEDELEGKGPKKPKTIKGCHASRNAYTLVYHRGREGEVAGGTSAPCVSCELEEEDAGQKRGQTDQHTDQGEESCSLMDLPIRTQRYLENDNLRFEEWVQEMNAIRKNNVDSGKARQSEVSNVFNMLQWKEGEEFEFVKTEWLSKWMSADTSDKVPSLNNSSLLCGHSKLDPHKVPHAKCISREAAEVLCSKYGAAVRLQRDSLCIQCVRERCRIIRTKARMAEDSKLITAFNKIKDQCLRPEECYWVGKQSLRCWKRLALELIQEPCEATEAGKKQNSDSVADTPASHEVVPQSVDCDLKEAPSGPGEEPPGCEAETDVKTQPGRDFAEEDADTDDTLHFNEDLLCDEHNELNIELASRKLLPPELWHRLAWYFPTAKVYRGDAETCSQCRAAVEEELKMKAFHKACALEQKASLGDLYADRKRPTWQHTEGELTVVTGAFIESWRRFIRDPQKNLPPEGLNNNSLLCPHGGFLYNPHTLNTQLSLNRMCLLYPQEWNVLKGYVSVDVHISIVCVKESTGHVTFIVTPDVCEECEASREHAEKQSRLHYTDAIVYVRKVTDTQGLQQDSVTETEGTEAACPASMKNGTTEQDITEPDSSKRKKSFSEDSYPAGKCVKVEPVAGGTRRSNRHRKARGEKELIVSSTHSLRDLKLQIMKLFSVAPYDQNLLLEGRLLKGDHYTLEHLHIYPGSVIYLKADEPVEDPAFLEDVSKVSYPEEGFKGTGLLGR